MYPITITLERYLMSLVFFAVALVSASAMAESQNDEATLSRTQMISQSMLPSEGTLPSYTKNGPSRFNYLWMQQYQPGYESREGTAALGKMLRIGIKTFYRNYRKSDVIRPGEGDDDIASSYAGVDYKLRLNEERISLRIGYDF